MLITNFAAGELAETLFGRTDLGQYYSGVSRLENFDVIPTGGISRRHGTKRITARDAEGEPVALGAGRIIPFIVDRENSFLLYLEPGRISVLDSGGVLLSRKESVAHPASYWVDNAFTPEKTGNTVLAGISGAAEGQFAEVKADETQHYRTAKYRYSGGRWQADDDFLLYDAADIEQVQYAQNFQTMILAHQRYPPLLLELYGGGITVRNFIPGFLVSVEKSDSGIKDPLESDREYTGKGYLVREGGYPGCVTFFNGRLVFAATKNSRQRVFASRVNDISNFSTYKLFLTSQKNYVPVRGTIGTDDDGRGVIYLDADAAPPLFTEKPTAYRVENAFFPNGGTVTDIKHDRIMVEGAVAAGLEGEALARYQFTQAKWAEYQGSILELDLMKIRKEERGSYNFIVYNTVKLRMAVRVESWTIKVVTTLTGLEGEALPDAQGPWEYALPANAAEEIEKNGDWASEYIDGLSYKAGYGAVSQGWSILEVYAGNKTSIKQRLKDLVMDTMWLRIPGMNPIYDTAPGIKSRVEALLAGWNNIYIALYTEHLIEDRHPSPDDGFTFEIASDMSDDIKWLAQNKNLLAGTETGEWLIPAAVNATNVQAILNSRYGSGNIQATSVGDAVCFFQTGKKALVEYYIPQQDSNFRANNMAMLSKNMLHESPAFDFDFISAPYTKIFVSREDGTVASLLYERGTGTFAWGRMTTGKEIAIVEDGRTVRTRTGLIKSVATIPGQAGYDDVYFIVKRGEAFFLERHSERIREDQEGDEAVFLDSYRRWDGDAAGYTDDAVVYDETANKAYPVTREPIPGHVMWIGYPYESRARSMPVLANDRMKQNNIKNLLIRFSDSFMPEVRSLSVEGGEERQGHTDSVCRKEPYSGVAQVPFPGVWGRDVFFELIHGRPTRCRVLAVNAEAN